MDEKIIDLFEMLEIQKKNHFNKINSTEHCKKRYISSSIIFDKLKEHSDKIEIMSNFEIIVKGAIVNNTQKGADSQSRVFDYHVRDFDGHEGYRFSVYARIAYKNLFTTKFVVNDNANLVCYEVLSKVSNPSNWIFNPNCKNILLSQVMSDNEKSYLLKYFEERTRRCNDKSTIPSWLQDYFILK